MAGGRNGAPDFDPQLLKSARVEEGLTLAALALAVDAHPNEVVEWENGRRVPQVDTLARLADALKRRPRDLRSRPEDGETTLLDLRIDAGLDQEEAARSAGLLRTTYSAIERGDVVSLAFGYDNKIAFALGSTAARVRAAHQAAVSLRRARRATTGGGRPALFD